MKKIFSILGICCLIVGLAATVTQVAVADTPAKGAKTVTKNISAADQQAALDFWTHDQLEAAPAFPMPYDGKYQAPSNQLFGMDVPADFYVASAVAAPGAASPDAMSIASSAYAADWAMMDDSADMSMGDVPADGAEIAGTKGRFTSYDVNRWSSATYVYPHVWVGRLSFRSSGGTGYCSATAISHNNIVTAAHCVYDTTHNKWYSSWVFTPAYRAGYAPYGSFSARSCTILTAWVKLSGGYKINTWARKDVAVCTVGTNSSGYSLNYMVGWAGRQWNAGYARDFFNMGYPWKNYKNKYIADAGRYLRTCTAESFQQATDTLGMGCNWGPGISGGPWLVKYAQAKVSGYVNSVNSGLYVGKKNLYGPRFTKGNIVPLCKARGC